jgi:hypothetical protein
LEGDESVVGDGDAMGVSAEILPGSIHSNLEDRAVPAGPAMLAPDAKVSPIRGVRECLRERRAGGQAHAHDSGARTNLRPERDPA